MVVIVVVVGNSRLFSFFSLSFPFSISVVVRKMANGRGVKAKDFFFITFSLLSLPSMGVVVGC